MSTIQVHYDGWLALPEAVRRKLGVATGDRLEVEGADGAVVLRPSRQADVVTPAAPEAQVAAEQPLEAEPASVAAPTTPVKRGPGRPRKVPADVALPPSPQARGR